MEKITNADLKISVSDQVTVSENRLELKLRGIGGFILNHFKWYRRLSGERNNQTDQKIIIDRTHPNKTSKYHQSIEYDSLGNIIDYHEHTDISEAVHR